MGGLMPSSEWQLDYYSHRIDHDFSSLTAVTGGTEISWDVLKSFFFGLMRFNLLHLSPFCSKPFAGQRFRLQETNNSDSGAVAAFTGQKSHTDGCKLLREEIT